MGTQSKREYVATIRGRYHRASRAEKQRILDECCAICGYHRKHAIRLLGQTPRRPQRRKGPAPRYTGEVVAALRLCWNAAGNLCGKRLKAALPLLLPTARAQELISPAAARLLRQMSAATMDRLLRPARRTLVGRGRSTTKPGTLLRTQIPVRTEAWDVTRPGFLEADTVAHCGSSMAGDFIHSLVLTDFYAGWTEQRAVWNKGEIGVLAAIQEIEAHLLFPLRGFDADNGGEFINHHLWRYCRNRRAGQRVEFTRSRPYKKNDNAHVEQKNWTHVRQLLGYARLDDPTLVDAINHLYVDLWGPYANFFLPSMKLVSKYRDGSVQKRRYDTPAAPAQRLLAHQGVSREAKAWIREQYRLLDPFQLRRDIDRAVAKILSRASVTSVMSQR